MARVLILEGNTADLLAGRTARGLPWAAEGFAAALRRFDPDLGVTIARPYLEGYDPDALPLEAMDGMVVTGSGVSWAADDARARPFWLSYERAFAAGLPVLGCCWGLQLGAVVLGGRVGAGPNGVEAGFARGLSLTAAGATHPLHAGRPVRFDALCMHRDDVLEPPVGAVVTATNAHTAVQGMVHEASRFWGLQYHPEISLADVAYYYTRQSGAFAGPDAERLAAAADLARIAADPGATEALQARHGVTADILDPRRHGAELGNWLAALPVLEGAAIHPAMGHEAGAAA